MPKKVYLCTLFSNPRKYSIACDPINKVLKTEEIKKKIVVTGTRGIPNIMGGVETHCEELFPRIVARGYDVTVIRRESYVRDNNKSYKGVRLLDIHAPRHKSFEAIIHTWRAIWAARRLQADILHIHACGPAILVPLARMLGMKVVFTHHGEDYDRDKWNWVAKMMLRFGEAMGAYGASEVIVISEHIQALLRSKYHIQQKMHLIYNGVSEAENVQTPEYFEDLGIEPGKYILGMCRFSPEKNLHHLIEAFSKIENRGCKLVLAGDSDFDDDYSKLLKRMAIEKGVILTGFVKGKKLHSLLNHTRCYVLPSSHEGLPIAMLEAMSYGAKIIVSDIPANKEVGLPEKNYFHCGDIPQLTAKLQENVDEPYSRQTYNMEKYNWDHIAEQVAAIYDTL